MKSIEDTLNLIGSVLKKIGDEDRIKIALCGGCAVIAYGMERPTGDTDFCVYSNIIGEKGPKAFVTLLNKVLLSADGDFRARLVEGGKIQGDPFQHDVIFIEDQTMQYPKADFIIARYKWELEGIDKAGNLKGISVPVLSKPYLIAMKLKAGGMKDDLDVATLYNLSDEKERTEIAEIAKRIHRDGKLAEIIERSRTRGSSEGPDDELIAKTQPGE